ncbi:peptide chain release factor 1-like, mitochondrial isoform X1 [Hemitrygon akajei]|uniref:peptide chain release factor 1-like, mitochondrial isoform X1 n=2 Tax=Hemitrygon akajei TaxID=2704970 RepID=UPI003BFA19D9
MFSAGRTLLDFACGHLRAGRCLAKLQPWCVRKAFHLKMGLGTSRPLDPAGPSRARTVEELFSHSSLQGYLRELEREYAESLESLAGCRAPPGLESDDTTRELQRRVGELAPVVNELLQLRAKEQELRDIESLLEDDDADLKRLAESEESGCQATIQGLKTKILSLLIPSEEASSNDLILEVTAGVGGQESMLFAAEMFEMYQGYAAYKHWDFDVLDYRRSELGGLRHAVASVSGEGSYGRLMCEGGVHRVQRIPRTERQGRIHTSTMTVVVLPQPTEIELTISPKDLRIETKRASGAGGQHVNTTDSAVRILHIPTGVVSECQQERSQLRNRERAMQMLRAKLYGRKLEEETSRRQQARSIQIGTRGRSEKIRTYNFPQDRVTDHRIGKSLYNLKDFMLGEELLDEMIEELRGLTDTEHLLEFLENMQRQQNRSGDR